MYIILVCVCVCEISNNKKGNELAKTGSSTVFLGGKEPHQI